MFGNRVALVALTTLTAHIALAACGDNSRVCGPGTTDVDGVCTGQTGDMCGNGTRLDPITNTCVPDPSTCGGGTVLINGVCQDPSAALEVDVLEGPEPNGFEDDATPAGIIPPLRPVGQKGIVIHGCIQPTNNLNPDFDNYLLSVTGPTLVKITADGVEGLAGAFAILSFSTDPRVAGYERFGINLATDVSRREVFLPLAGTYSLVISDARTLQALVTGAEALPPAGNPDGTSCYYVTVDQKNPTIKSLDLATGDTGMMGEDLNFYTATLPSGFTSVTASLDTPFAASALQIHNNNDLRLIVNGNPDATAAFGGILPGDTPMIVFDHVFNMALEPVAYTINGVATASQALPLDGTSINATSNGQSFSDFGDINTFHWDVAAANNTDGIDITFSRPVQGVIADRDGQIVAQMSGLAVPTVGGQPAPNTFTAYRGLLNEATPGRYYFFLFAPRDPVGTPFTVTSTIKTRPVPDLVPPAGLAALPVSEFNSEPAHVILTGSSVWQQIDAGGTNTNGVVVRVFSRSSVAAGRLDSLVVTRGPGAGAIPTCAAGCPTGFVCGTGGLCVAPAERTPFIAFDGANAFPDTGNPRPRIFRNPLSTFPPVPTDLFVVANPVAQTGANRVLHFDFQPRSHEAFGGAIVAGTTKTLANQTLDATTTELRYFAETAKDNLVRITATPVTPGMDVRISMLNNDESTRLAIDAGGSDVAETHRYGQNASGFNAWKVTANIPGTYALEVKVDPAFYKVMATSTAFADACTGGTQHTLIDKTGLGFNPRDEGLTAAIAAPAGFTFYGNPVTDFVVASNGFLSFNTSITSSNFFVAELPDGRGETNIAPAWDDLVEVVVCTKTVGGKLVVQWTGTEFSFFGPGAPVQMQAILDPADDSIEYVYGPNMLADGRGASSGVQTLAGDEATGIGAFSTFLAPSTSKKLVP